jgi:hypothetical protein
MHAAAERGDCEEISELHARSQPMEEGAGGREARTAEHRWLRRSCHG